MPRFCRLLLVVAVAAGLSACSDDIENPFDQFSFSRAPSEDAVLFFVSGAWAAQPGAPRELFAVNADGSQVERLTTCTQRSSPCDFLEVVPSTVRERVAAVRGAFGGDPEVSALYFIDLDRSVETIISLDRRVQAADWAIDDRFIVFSSALDGANEDLRTVPPNGGQEEQITATPDLRERHPRLDFQLTNAVYEVLDRTPGKSRIFLLLDSDTGQPVALTEGGPGTEVLEGTPYIVGSDSTPAYSTDRLLIAFRRLTGTGNGGLGTWDLLTLRLDGDEGPVVVAGGGGVHRGAPDWSLDGQIAFVETDMEAGESRLVVVEADGSGRQVLHVENAGFRMGSPRWIR
jgi:Tol biopolymer transport system component